MKKFRGVDLYDLDPLLSEEERMVRQTVREFVDAELLPVIREAWEEGSCRSPSSPRSPRWASSAPDLRATAARA